MKSSVQAAASGLRHSVDKDSSVGEHGDSVRRPTAVRAESAVPVARDEENLLDTTVISGDTARMLHTLLGNLDGMVYRCRDDQSWTMEFVSEGCRRLTGYDADDLLLNDRVSYESITHPEDRPRVREEIHNGLVLRKR